MTDEIKEYRNDVQKCKDAMASYFEIEMNKPRQGSVKSDVGNALTSIEIEMQKDFKIIENDHRTFIEAVKTILESTDNTKRIEAVRTIQPYLESIKETL